MSENIYLITVLLPLATLLLIFALKYISAAYQARVRAASDASYRELAQSAISAQVAANASIAAMQQEVTQISQRLAQVTKILQEVE